MTGHHPRALGLMSGGLDSTLAAHLMRSQGVEVLGLHFSTGFCVADRHRLIGNVNNPGRPYRNDAVHAGAQLRVPVEIIDIREHYMERVVLQPRHGYGAGMNPCIDCRIYMLQQAHVVLQERGYDFVFTGEVLGQRPLSQRRVPMQQIAEESGLHGLLLRPLSARLMPPTVAEQRGWVDRAQLFAMSGRSRAPQIALAEELGVIDYPQPSGGCCYLPDENFARKLRDLLAHRGPHLEPDEMMLLKLGRHFRLSSTLKAIVGRNQDENGLLERFTSSRGDLRVEDRTGALTLLEGSASADSLELACRIAARYSTGRDEERVRVRWRHDGAEGTLMVEPLTGESALEELRV
jgi:tRNA U34 2-thiouridine synthase MnmA/TrmU